MTTPTDAELNDIAIRISWAIEYGNSAKARAILRKLIEDAQEDQP